MGQFHKQKENGQLLQQGCGSRNVLKYQLRVEDLVRKCEKGDSKTYANQKQVSSVLHLRMLFFANSVDCESQYHQEEKTHHAANVFEHAVVHAVTIVSSLQELVERLH